MAELRRPSGNGGGGGGGGGGAARRPASRAPGARPGGASAARRAPARKPTPKWVWVGLVVAPIILVLVTVQLMLSRREAANTPREIVHDPNQQLKALELKVSSLQDQYRAVAKLIRAEDPNAKTKTQALLAQMTQWMESWDSILRPLEDKEGRPPEELRGYQRVRSSVNQLYNDLLKQAEF